MFPRAWTACAASGQTMPSTASAIRMSNRRNTVLRLRHRKAEVACLEPGVGVRLECGDLTADYTPGRAFLRVLDNLPDQIGLRVDPEGDRPHIGDLAAGIAPALDAHHLQALVRPDRLGA